MESNLAEAIKLMITGMTSVFSILIFVVLLGNLIIILTNKLSSGKVLIENQKPNQDIDAKKLAIILSAVEAATGGKGKVTSIQKSDN